MILENLLRGWAGTDQHTDVGVMDPHDFLRMCQETRALPVSGMVVHIVNGRRFTFMPLRNGSKAGQTHFTTMATAQRWRAS